jgi:GT2 family glycosyltransferase
MQTPDVSIILPVRNGERFLREAIRSALATREPSRELIVIDDGSTDSSPEIVAAEARSDARIVSLSQPAIGLVAALEGARRHARAPLIARLDSDDLAYPRRFERQLAAFAERPELALLGAVADKIDEAGRVVGRVAYSNEASELRRELQLRNPFTHSMVMFRADRVSEIGGYRSYFDAAEDYDLWLRLAERWEVANLPDCLGAVRIHGDSVSRRGPERQMLSAALARRAAVARQRPTSQPVPAADRPETELQFADELDERDISLYRALEFALASTFALRQPSYQNVCDLMMAADFDREEKKLAQRALANILARGQLPERLSWARVAAAFVRIDPVRAMRLAPRIVRSRSA